MKVKYAALFNLFSTVFLETIGASFRLPVSAYSRRRRSECSSEARVVRISA